MPRLKPTRAARDDPRDIYAYTYAEWGEQQADSYLDGLKQAMDRVAKDLATIRPLQSKHPNMLKLKQGRHLIVLQETDDGQILVVRVPHDSMDIDAHLGDSQIFRPLEPLRNRSALLPGATADVPAGQRPEG